jgi:hypothetical protein
MDESAERGAGASGRIPHMWPPTTADMIYFGAGALIAWIINAFFAERERKKLLKKFDQQTGEFYEAIEELKNSKTP